MERNLDRNKEMERNSQTYLNPCEYNNILNMKLLEKIEFIKTLTEWLIVKE